MRTLTEFETLVLLLAGGLIVIGVALLATIR
jgi:hypothetical protein